RCAGRPAATEETRGTPRADRDPGVSRFGGYRQGHPRVARSHVAARGLAGCRRHGPDGAMITVGLLGGTFDPIHHGHLDVALAARQALGLDEVRLIPARHPPHRTRPVASAAHRFAMAALAVSSEPSLRVSDA